MRPAETSDWHAELDAVVDRWLTSREDRPSKGPCIVPGCLRRRLASFLCARHYMQVHDGNPLTLACEGAERGIPGACRKPHPLTEPPDPPIPDGLLAVCTEILERAARRSRR